MIAHTGPPGRRSRPITQPAGSNVVVTTTDIDIVDDHTERDERPHCRVVGHYCEALGWLRREPTCPSSVCCRHFWADAEAVAGHD